MVKRELLERLAPFEPILDSECKCVFCGAWSRFYSRARAEDAHGQDCPWVGARKLLGDTLPKGGTE